MQGHLLGVRGVRCGELEHRARSRQRVHGPAARRVFYVAHSFCHLFLQTRELRDVIDLETEPKLAQMYVILQTLYAYRWAHTPVYAPVGAYLFSSLEAAKKYGHTTALNHRIQPMKKGGSTYSWLAQGEDPAKLIPSSQLAVYRVIGPTADLESTNLFVDNNVHDASYAYYLVNSNNFRVVQRAASLEESAPTIEKLEQMYKKQHQRIREVQRSTQRALDNTDKHGNRLKKADGRQYWGKEDKDQARQRLDLYCEDDLLDQISYDANEDTDHGV